MKPDIGFFTPLSGFPPTSFPETKKFELRVGIFPRRTVREFGDHRSPVKNPRVFIVFVPLD
jgi:hypothetical protein